MPDAPAGPLAATTEAVRRLAADALTGAVPVLTGPPDARGTAPAWVNVWLVAVQPAPAALAPPGPPGAPRPGAGLDLRYLLSVHGPDADPSRYGLLDRLLAAVAARPLLVLAGGGRSRLLVEPLPLGTAAAFWTALRCPLQAALLVRVQTSSSSAGPPLPR